MTLTWLSGIALLLGIVLATGIVVRALVKGSLHWSRKGQGAMVILLAIGVLLACSGPWQWERHQDRQQVERNQEALKAFEAWWTEQNPELVEAGEKVTLIDFGNEPNTWLYAYHNQGVRHTAVRIGDGWVILE